MSTHELSRTMSLPVPATKDVCDGCGMELAAGIVAEYRLDGALFCTPRCASLHAGIPMDTSGRPHTLTPPTEIV